MLGVKLIVVKDKAELEVRVQRADRHGLHPRRSGRRWPARHARGCRGRRRRHNVPLVVDAAAEILTIKPNVHLRARRQCRRLQRRQMHPRTAGRRPAARRKEFAAGRLGQQRAAPRFRPLGEGRQGRDHGHARRRRDVGQARPQGGVGACGRAGSTRSQRPSSASTASPPRSASPRPTSRIARPSSSSNGTPAKLGITGQDVFKLLLETEPRIELARSRAPEHAVAVVPYQMHGRRREGRGRSSLRLLSKPPKIEPPPPPPTGPASNVAGIWELKLEFQSGTAGHKLMFEQDGARLVGTHEGEFASGDLSGTVAGNRVRFQSSLPTEGQRVSFQFEGTEQGGKLAGTVGLGEYGEARWTAERHPYRTGGRRG